MSRPRTGQRKRSSSVRVEPRSPLPNTGAGLINLLGRYHETDQAGQAQVSSTWFPGLGLRCSDGGSAELDSAQQGHLHLLPSPSQDQRRHRSSSRVSRARGGQVMCYNCTVCGTTSKPKQPKRVWCIYRTVPVPYSREGQPSIRQEIEKELPVCEKCYKLLTDGVPLSILSRQRGKCVRSPERHKQVPVEF